MDVLTTIDIPEMPKSAISRGKSKKIDEPAKYFDHWFFDIQPYHWEIFGVSKREFVKDKKPYLAWAIDVPETTTVFAGYIFYKKHHPEVFAQVVATWLDKTTKEPMVEVHTGQTCEPAERRGLVLSSHELRQWLETGKAPISREIVDLANSRGGLFAWGLTQ